mmetsp:Transcript_27468/g.54947  ORF Transcript_27468/g.54947 Transcript_27468/m.54947 type:complete len:321 (+) Transcript_27468:84-1046(+)
MGGPLRRGVVWISQQTAMVQANYKTSCHAVSPMRQRGAGYRLPTNSAYQPLADHESAPVTASEIVDGVDWFHDQNIHPRNICFGGAYSEPLAPSSWPAVEEALVAIRERRHGTPLVLMTNGLHPGDAVGSLVGLHEEWRDAPGSDGDSRLSVVVEIAGANPPEYSEVMRPTATKQGFQQVCGFVTTLVEAGIRVYGAGSHHPAVKNLKQVEQVSRGIGCTDFFARTYHPTTLYDVLGLPDETCDPEAIKEAYRAKAKALHPDVLAQGTGEEGGATMVEVTEAYAVLGDEKLRLLYENGVADLILNDREEDYFSSVVNKSI